MKEISLLKDQCHHSTAQTIHSFQGSAKFLDDNDNTFLQKLSSSSSRPFINSPHVIVFSNGTTIILRKMGPVHTIGLAKQFRLCKALIAFEQIVWRRNELVAYVVDLHVET